MGKVIGTETAACWLVCGQSAPVQGTGVAVGMAQNKVSVGAMVGVGVRTLQVSERGSV